MAAEDELIREVDEALKQERLKALWNTHGKTIATIAALIVLGVGGWSYWQQEQAARNQARTAQLMQGREWYKDGQFEKAKEEFTASLTDAKGAVVPLTYLWLAKAELKLGNPEAALDAYAAAATTNPKPSAFETLACVEGAMLAPEDARFQACQPSEASQPFYALMQEDKAIRLAVREETAAALAALPQGALPMTQQRRLYDLRAYVSSLQDAPEKAALDATSDSTAPESSAAATDAATTRAAEPASNE